MGKSEEARVRALLLLPTACYCHQGMPARRTNPYCNGLAQARTPTLQYYT